MALRRILKEQRDLEQNPSLLPKGCSIKTSTDAFEPTASISAPEGTPYEGGIFELSIKYPQDYPFKPPKIKFVTEIYHYNVTRGSGHIGFELTSSNWSPACTIWRTLEAVRHLLRQPDPHSIMEPEIYKQFKSNIQLHHKTAREWTQKYAMKGPLKSQKSKPKSNMIEVPVRVEGGDIGWYSKCSVSVPYDAAIKIYHVLTKIMDEINQITYPKSMQLHSVLYHSFIATSVYCDDASNEWQRIISKPLTDYDTLDIISKGMFIQINNVTIHKVKNVGINCTFMKNKKSSDPLQCDIYCKMKQDYDWSEDNLKHLLSFTHFNDAYEQKPACKYGLQCHAFVRLEQGDNRLNDRCHAQLFRHPPRKTHQFELQQNMHAFVFHKEEKENHDVYMPPYWEIGHLSIGKQYQMYLEKLIKEVVENGYKSDLCLTDDDAKNDRYTLLQVADEKLNHIRHKNMGNPLSKHHMLALLLYTGCDCNYDLCRSQRNNDYTKWKWFDCCLYEAIKRLNIKERGAMKLYSGLENVQLDAKEVQKGYFATYVSTTWKKEVSCAFMAGKGMIIEIDDKMRNILKCCDVSWISKFPDECEVLIARSWYYNSFTLKVSDYSKDGIQTVVLRDT